MLEIDQKNEAFNLKLEKWLCEFTYLVEKSIFDFFRYGYFIIVKIDKKLLFRLDMEIHTPIESFRLIDTKYAFF